MLNFEWLFFFTHHDAQKCEQNISFFCKKMKKLSNGFFLARIYFYIKLMCWKFKSSEDILYIAQILLHSEKQHQQNKCLENIFLCRLLILTNDILL